MFKTIEKPGVWLAFDFNARPPQVNFSRDAGWKEDDQKC